MSDWSIRCKTVENETAGYRVTRSRAEACLHVECWGYWSAEVAASFERDVSTAYGEISSMKEFTLDARSLKPQGGHGQAALRTMMAHLSVMETGRCVVIADNALTKMQLTRLAKEHGVDLSGKVNRSN